MKVGLIWPAGSFSAHAFAEQTRSSGERTRSVSGLT